MHQSRGGPELDATIVLIKKSGLAVDKEAAKQHLENLLYVKSVLYLDDKNNEKHLRRIHAVLDSLKKEFAKELNEAGQSEDEVCLVAQILIANKIIDNGIERLKNQMARVVPVETTPSKTVVVGTMASVQENKPLAAEELRSQTEQASPPLRETLRFLLSVVGDPLRVTDQLPLHLGNLEKISKLIKRKYQDAKIQRLAENVLGVLSKIYGTNDSNELSQLFDNSIKILKNFPRYKALINDFEGKLKSYLVPSSELAQGAEGSFSAKQAQVEKFYKAFKDEKNMMSKISLLKIVLTSSAYIYDRELNAACSALLKELEKMGLQFEITGPNC